MMRPAILKDTARGIQAVDIADVLLSERRIFLNEEINAQTAGTLLMQLMVLEKENPEQEIFLHINSPGGDVVSGMAVYDYIAMMKAPVRTICTGIAASMGAIVFLAGARREMFPHTRLMIHDPSFNRTVPGLKALELQEMADGLMQTRRILCGVIAERTGKPLEEVYERTCKDTYFTAQEAVDFGLATDIAGKQREEVKS